MKVSVISTVYNEGADIKPMLDSLLDQTRMPDEIVIVDGGSTDETQEILRRYEEQHDRLEVVVRDGVNIAVGRNIAVEQAAHDVILGIDGGCRADNRWVEDMVAQFDDGADAVAGMFEPITDSLFEYVQGKLVTSSYDAAAIRKNDRAPSSRSIGFRRHVWEEAGGYPEDLYTGEDTRFNAQVQAAGYEFVPAPDALVKWKMRQSWQSFFDQFYTYGKGDARANNLLDHPSKLGPVPKNLLLIGSIWIGLLGLLAAVFDVRSLLFSVMVGTALFGYHADVLPVMVEERGLSTLPLWLGLVVTKLLGYFLGFHAELLQTLV